MEGDLMKRISIGIVCVGMAAVSVGCGKSSPQQETRVPQAATARDRDVYDRTAQNRSTRGPSDPGVQAVELQAQQANRDIHEVTAAAQSDVERVKDQAEDVSEAVNAVKQAVQRPFQIR